MLKHYIDFIFLFGKNQVQSFLKILFLELSQWNDFHFSNYIIKIQVFLLMNEVALFNFKLKDIKLIQISHVHWLCPIF